MKADDLCSIAALLWAAWTCRNKILFENESPDAVRVAMGFVKLIVDYRSYSKWVFAPTTWSGCYALGSTWTKPPYGFAKINTDAHVIDGVKIGLGVVVRNSDGEVVLTTTKSQQATSS